ncbi:MAG: Gfo/Idh/MocA family oxidoreductase [Robiginitalea sp.]
MIRPLLLMATLFVMHLPLPAQNEPLRIAVIGLTHTHVNWIFESEKRGEIRITGIVEANRELASRYAARHGFSMDRVYKSPEALLAAEKPEAVTAFGTIYEHLQVVETFAPLGIHVMVEKPLAVSLEHAKKMADLAQKHGIQLLTNYETTWYPTNHRVFETVIREEAIGPIRKIVVRDGHRGPK